MPPSSGSRRTLARRLLDHELPGPVYAAVGLIDRVKSAASTGANAANLPTAPLRAADQSFAGVRTAIVERDLAAAIVAVPAGVGDAALRLTAALARTPGTVVAAATDEYDALVDRGQTRSVEIAAEQVVRKRVSRFEDQLAPRAARATVRWNDRRHRWNASPAGQRVQTARLRARVARERAREAAQRFGEFNAPVLAQEPGPDAGAT